MHSEKLNLTDLKNPTIRTLHLSWIDFFIGFFVRFSFAPLMAFIEEAL